jgi:hypothetical protein
MNNKVFVIKRAYTDTCFSIANNKNPSKPCVLAFTEKRDAQFFKGTIVQFQDKSRPHQKLKIEELPSKYLFESCGVNTLDIILYHKGGVHTHIAPGNAIDVDDMRFSLENCFKYYSQ